MTAEFGGKGLPLAVRRKPVLRIDHDYPHASMLQCDAQIYNLLPDHTPASRSGQRLIRSQRNVRASIGEEQEDGGRYSLPAGAMSHGKSAGEARGQRRRAADT